MNVMTKRNSLLFFALLIIVAMTSFVAVGEGSGSDKPLSLQPVPVVVVAGQSNAMGVNTPLNDLAEPIGQNSADNQVELKYATHSGNSWTFSDSESRLSAPQPYGVFGPELTLGRELYSSGFGDLVVLKVVDNGRKLAFSQTDQTWHPKAKKNSYEYLETQYEELKSELRNDGKYPDVIGFVWVQGESDATREEYADAYLDNLEQFFGKLREDKIIYSKTGVVIAQVGPECMGACSQPDIGMATVRSAQRKFAQDSDYKLIDIASFPRFENDPIHITARGQERLGEQSARYINALYSSQNPDYISSLSVGLK